ncbi:hypothetical protein PMAYCL1PPCAC_09103, partial [Pristionchus mayeri]
SSSFVYINDDDMIYVLNTNTMELLEPFTFDGSCRRIHVTRVFNEEITAISSIDSDLYLVTAQLLPGYCLNSATSSNELTELQRMEQRIKEV